MNPALFAALAAAGGLGAGLRYAVDVAVMRGHRGRFPLGILVVNITGSLALGVVAGMLTGPLAAIVGVGLLGGYTTFSTVSVESVLLAERRQRRRAVRNAVATVVACVAAAMLGMLVATALVG